MSLRLHIHIRPVVAAAALALVVVPATAAADTTTTAAVAQSKLLWATVNVCDTPDHPATIGVRASIPGDGVAAEEVFVRFQAQYLATDGTWHTVARGADSGFVALGPAKAKARETGRLFVFAPPAGQTWVLRGLVTYDWRAADGTIVRRLRRFTTPGHRSAAGADPQGFTAGTCSLG